MGKVAVLVLAVCVAIGIVFGMRSYKENVEATTEAARATPSTSSATPAPMDGCSPLGERDLPQLDDRDIRMTIIGDSFTYGQGADPITRGFAHQLDDLLAWQVELLPNRGAGYTSNGTDLRPEADFGDMTEKVLKGKVPDVLLIQGSANDLNHTGIGPTAYRLYNRALTEAPNLVVIGLGPFPAPDIRPTMGEVNEAIRYAAECLSVPFIDPFASNWRVEHRPGGDVHPTQAGHDYVAKQVAASIKELAQAG